MNSKAKGKRGELEWAAILREVFGITDARRGVQYKGTPDSPDVVGIPGLHAEVKRTEHLNIHEAMKQAEEDVKGSRDIPYVAHRRNHSGWMVTVQARDLVEFCLAFLKAPRGEVDYGDGMQSDDQQDGPDAQHHAVRPDGRADDGDPVRGG